MRVARRTCLLLARVMPPLDGRRTATLDAAPPGGGGGICRPWPISESRRRQGAAHFNECGIFYSGHPPQLNH